MFCAMRGVLRTQLSVAKLVLSKLTVVIAETNNGVVVAKTVVRAQKALEEICIVLLVGGRNKK